MPARLLDYPWPGNVRELKHALERACVLSEGRALSPDAVFERPAKAEEQKGISALGISRKNLWQKMRKLDISRS